MAQRYDWTAARAMGAVTWRAELRELSPALLTAIEEAPTVLERVLALGHAILWLEGYGRGLVTCGEITAFVDLVPLVAQLVAAQAQCGQVSCSQCGREWIGSERLVGYSHCDEHQGAAAPQTSPEAAS